MASDRAREWGCWNIVRLARCERELCGSSSCVIGEYFGKIDISEIRIFGISDRRYYTMCEG